MDAPLDDNKQMIAIITTKIQVSTKRREKEGNIGI
jgi:hypothetical protein